MYHLQGDVVAIQDSTGATVVEYKYNAWGKLLAVTGSMASTLGRQNPIRYRGYEYDEESGLYYLRSRYYNPDTGRFISADSVMGRVGEVLSHNLYCYCGNSIINHADDNGNFGETLFDVITWGASVIEVCLNPKDPLAWAGLVGDTIDLTLFVTGVGESIRTIKTTVKVVDNAEDIISTAKKIDRLSDVSSDIWKATGSYQILYKNDFTYIGKRGFNRAITSALSHGDIEDICSILWKSAPTQIEAFRDEYYMQKFFLGEDWTKIKDLHTFNKIWSPGKNYAVK